MNAIRFVFIDNVFSPAHSDISLLPKEIVCEYQAESMRLHVPKNVTLSQPIYFLHQHTDESKKTESIWQSQIIIDENSSIIIVDEYQGNTENYKRTMQVNMRAEKSARIFYHKIQNEAKNATHYADLAVFQK